MVVAYTDENEMAEGDVGQPINVLNKRNTTVSIGCSCVLRQSDMVESYVQGSILQNSISAENFSDKFSLLNFHPKNKI
jgi:hypothetical protein